MLIPVIICVSFIVYTLVDLAPGTAIDAMITSEMTQEDVDALRAAYDLDKPMIYRYGKYMINFVQGDLGVSLVNRRSVWETYMHRLPNTLVLAFSGLIIGVAVAIPLGIQAAKKAGSIADSATTVFVVLGISMPSFWLALLLIRVFAQHLGWVPVSSIEMTFRGLVLPAVCSGVMLMATATRQTRSSMLDVLRADFLRTARAKGVPESVVINKHALGNALIPIVTVIGGSLSMSLAGSVIIEQVFAWPGVGRMAVEAVLQRDVPTVLGTVILTSTFYVLIQIIVDLVYAFIDPRIKSQYITAKRKKSATPADKPVSVSDVFGSSATGADAALSAAEVTEDQAAAFVQAETAGAVEQEPVAETDAPYVAAQVNAADSVVATPAEEVSLSATVSTVETAAKTDKRDDVVQEEADNSAALVTRKYKKRSQFGEILYRLRKNKGAMAGLVIVIFIFLCFLYSLFFISFRDITTGVVRLRLSAPSWEYPFGTDSLGRNLLLRVLYGSRYSLAIGFAGSIIAACIGVTLGAYAGYYGGMTEGLIMRAAEVLTSIPGMLLGIVIMSTLGSSLRNLIITVGITSVPIYIRMTRASILSLRNQEYVEAARAIGLPNGRIIFRQILPNGLSPILITFTMNLGMMILIASGLSFLGFGILPPLPEWGTLIAGGREFERNAPHLLTFPGLFIMITVLSFNLLGDGLRDALDPKLKVR